MNGEVEEITLERRPAAAPVLEDFGRARRAARAPAPGEAWIANHFLSLDPYMRGRMNEGANYAASQQLGEAMIGETVGVVLAAGAGAPTVGSWVIGYGGWRSHWLAGPGDATVFDPGDHSPSRRLGALGMPGLTAFAAWRRIARPESGDTVVVPAATGAVGAIAGQLAKIEGARVVGVASGAAKCAYAIETLGFDACVDRKTSQFDKALARACPNGVDVILDSTGGAVLDAALALANCGARIPVIGSIAFAKGAPPSEGGDQTPAFLRKVLTHRLRVQGMIVWDHEDLRPAFEREVGALLDQGRLVAREDVTEGLENAPAAFLRMLSGDNFGKTIVRITH